MSVIQMAPARTLALLCVAAVLCVAVQESLAASSPSSSRQTRYQVYFEPGLCPVDVAEQVDCPSSLPICCVSNNAVRCCASNTPCEDCESDVIGYQMARGSVIIGVMSLVMVLLIGTLVTSGLGRHLAWSLERRRVIKVYKEKMQLRRTAAKRFKDELAATEERDLPDEVACTICCARRMDCGLAPCGHICCCHFCAQRLKECPVCRVAVEQCYDLPDYLVSRLVGEMASDEQALATGAAGEGVAPGVESEMRELYGSAECSVEDERQMAGLLSTDASSKGSQKHTSKNKSTSNPFRRASRCEDTSVTKASADVCVSSNAMVESEEEEEEEEEASRSASHLRHRAGHR